MNKAKRKRLEAGGWKVGTVRDFLNLSSEEEALMELKLQMSAHLQKRRRAHKMTQVELARRLNSSQSRVAKMEAGDPSVSLDLLVRSLLALGVSTNSILRSLPR
jgi:DNA-binding XRE family transcriptional regulator